MTKPCCPKCGNEDIYYVFTCHTWQNHANVWMSCIGCDSATEYTCSMYDGGCGWSYIDGYNPRNPRFAKNEENRPSWLDDGFVDKIFGIDTRVKYGY